jgi:hypothetical protein
LTKRVKTEDFDQVSLHLRSCRWWLPLSSSGIWWCTGSNTSILIRARTEICTMSFDANRTGSGQARCY